jgi:hypothetical protein
MSLKPDPRDRGFLITARVKQGDLNHSKIRQAAVTLQSVRFYWRSKTTEMTFAEMTFA